MQTSAFLGENPALADILTLSSVLMYIRGRGDPTMQHNRHAGRQVRSKCARYAGRVFG